MEGERWIPGRVRVWGKGRRVGGDASDGGRGVDRGGERGARRGGHEGEREREERVRRKARAG
eukprot:167321-Rhodomonas_salina.1